MTTQVEQWDREHLWRYRSHVWRIIDGDTFVALPDVGFDGAAFPRIRLLNYDAAERYAEGGGEATAALSYALNRYGLVTSRNAWPLRIESKIRERVVEGTKSFDRYLATVWVVDPHGGMADVREILLA
jgi:hypothetical protein